MPVGFVYILSSNSNKVLYVGVTSELKVRIVKHKNNHYPGSFTSRYNVHKLVWYREFPIMIEAIKEEKRIKGGSRQKKLNLVNNTNPEWDDLFGQLE